MPKCGKEPNKAFSRAAWLNWQSCMSGNPVEKGFGVRKKAKKSGIVESIMGAFK